MLTGLKIENIAVIENASLEFGSGLNVLTGETGAGKSIVIDSINAVIGERTSRELIRDGCDKAKVVAQFSDIGANICTFLHDNDIEKNEDNSLIISRSISLSGKNICKINDWPVTVSKLKELGAMLINIHGQHDSLTLMSQDKQLEYIDLLAGNSEVKGKYKSAFSELIKTKKKLDRLYDLSDEKNSRLEYINFVIDEISGAEIRDGEEEELLKEKELIQNSSDVKKALEKAYIAISEENGLSDSVAACSDELDKFTGLYADIDSVAKGLKGLSYDLSEYASQIRDLSDKFFFGSERISEINDRLDVIYRLSMKYGKNEKEILENYDKLIAEKDELDNFDDKIVELEKTLCSNSDTVKKYSSQLTASRKKTALDFEKKVIEELRFLDMPNVEFKVDIKETPLNSKGAESVNFLMSVNPGQAPEPISKIASGGELSRIMLAIKNVLSGADETETLVFDEIDTGVSGSAAEKIALKLDSVSKGRQVICVTHLPRIAAQADNHFKIIKTVDKNQTYTSIIPLDFDERAEELANITAGSGVTPLQIETAKEMLNKAKETKK